MTIKNCLGLLILLFANTVWAQEKLASYQEYASWPEYKQTMYTRQLRKAWTRFASPRKFTWDITSGLPTGPDAKICLVGGWQREMFPDGKGDFYCPTVGKGCAPLGEQGFDCGPI